jgi:predicted dehydrogenase
VVPAASVEDALARPEVEAAIVSVPGALHVPYCRMAADAGKHWFSEIPLSVNLRGVDELLRVSAARGLVGAVGCQTLFHPLLEQALAWAREEETGRLLAASYSLGTYLPEWHPYEDYRKFYASNLAMGGGNVDVLAQELVWLSAIAGEPIVAVMCRMGKVGPLELAEGTPDHQELIIEYASGLMLTLHLDLNDLTHERWLRFTAQNATMKWETSDNVLRTYSGKKRAWSEKRLPEGFVYETCYQREIGRFLECIREGKEWVVKPKFSREVVAVLEAMQVSDRERRTVDLKEVLR